MFNLGPESSEWAPETVWWDGDLTREFEDGANSGATSPVINKFDPSAVPVISFAVLSKSGRMSLRNDLINIREMLHELKTEMMPIGAERGVDVVLVDTGDLEVQGDALKFLSRARQAGSWRQAASSPCR